MPTPTSSRNPQSPARRRFKASLAPHQADCGGHGSILVVGLVAAGAEGRHDAVTYELFDLPSAYCDRAEDLLEMSIEDIEQAGRVVREPLRQPGEAAQIREQDGGGAHHGCGSGGQGQETRAAVLICLPQVEQPGKVVTVSRQCSSSVFARDHVATCSEARDSVSLSSRSGPCRTIRVGAPLRLESGGLEARKAWSDRSQRRRSGPPQCRVPEPWTLGGSPGSL